MNFFAILDQLAAADADFAGRFDPRRAVFRHLGAAAARAALATAPVLLSGLFQRAYAGTNAATPVDILNFALKLEYLEADFYARFIGSGLLPAGSPTTAILKIKQHEDSHVKLLQAAITALGGTPGPAVQFRQAVFDANKTYAGLLTIAQVLEDTGVRAYKGQVPGLQGLANVMVGGASLSLLTTALQIHSVEARHAAHIRLLRNQTPWVSPTDDAASNAAYSGTTAETNTLQSNLELTTGLGTNYAAGNVAAAFDEILTMDEVLSLSRVGGLT